MASHADVFSDCAFWVSPEITVKHGSELKALIVAHGGSITEDVNDANALFVVERCAYGAGVAHEHARGELDRLVAKGVRVLARAAVFGCAERGKSPLAVLGNNARILQSFALEDCVVCTTGCNSDARAECERLTRALGGRYVEALDVSVTHLLCAQVTTSKYKSSLHMPDVHRVTLDWLHACYARDTALSNVHDYAVPVFLNMTVTDTGFGAYDEIKSSFKTQVEGGGGTYTRDLTKAHTHLLVKGMGRSKKYSFAIANNIKVVSVQWFYDCVTRGVSCNEDDYAVEPDEHAVNRLTAEGARLQSTQLQVPSSFSSQISQLTTTTTTVTGARSASRIVDLSRCVVFVVANGHDSSSVDMLAAICTQLGGSVASSYTPEVTHTVVCTHPKVDGAPAVSTLVPGLRDRIRGLWNTAQRRTPVVQSQWLIECGKAERYLNIQPYMLMTNASNLFSKYVFTYTGFSDVDAADLEIFIHSNGGVVRSADAPGMSQAPVDFIVQAHGSSAPVAASTARQRRKSVVSTQWLEACVSDDFVHDTSFILHRPLPYVLPADFLGGDTIALAGFRGEEKTNLKVLIREMGGVFASKLNKSCAVVVCKDLAGAKYRVARRIGVPIVLDNYLFETARQGRRLTIATYAVDTSVIDSRKVGERVVAPASKPTDLLSVRKESRCVTYPLAGVSLFVADDISERFKASLHEKIRKLGGDFSFSLDESVTHYVSDRKVPSSSKIGRASRSRNVAASQPLKQVSTKWVEQCYATRKLLDEDAYPCGMNTMMKLELYEKSRYSDGENGGRHGGEVVGSVRKVSGASSNAGSSGKRRKLDMKYDFPDLTNDRSIDAMMERDTGGGMSAMGSGGRRVSSARKAGITREIGSEDVVMGRHAGNITTSTIVDTVDFDADHGGIDMDGDGGDGRDSEQFTGNRVDIEEGRTDTSVETNNGGRRLKNERNSNVMEMLLQMQGGDVPVVSNGGVANDVTLVFGTNASTGAHAPKPDGRGAKQRSVTDLANEDFLMFANDSANQDADFYEAGSHGIVGDSESQGDDVADSSQDSGSIELQSSSFVGGSNGGGAWDADGSGPKAGQSQGDGSQSQSLVQYYGKVGTEKVFRTALYKRANKKSVGGNADRRRSKRATAKSKRSKAPESTPSPDSHELVRSEQIDQLAEVFGGKNVSFLEEHRRDLLRIRTRSNLSEGIAQDNGGGTEEPEQKYVFLFSGFSRSSKQPLIKAVADLGGTVVEQYSHRVTHLLVKRANRTPKFLSGCAAGKWLLNTRFIIDSITEMMKLKAREGGMAATAGGEKRKYFFKDEEEYEWFGGDDAESSAGRRTETAGSGASSVGSTVDGKAKESLIHNCARRCRLAVQRTGKCLFEHMVVGCSPYFNMSLHLVLKAGGATILSLPNQLTSKNRPDLEKCTHLMIDKSKKVEAEFGASVVKLGYPLLEATYIVDAILKGGSPGPVEQYLYTPR